MKKIVSFYPLLYGLLLLPLLTSCLNEGGGGSSSKSEGIVVSGTIKAADNSAVDNDVNDILADYASNDTFEEAQSLPNPVVLGGYVNLPGTGWVGMDGDVGRSYASGDVNDFYVVTLTANQTVTLYLADFDEAAFGVDINLFLYDENRTLVASSESLDATKVVEVVDSGLYYIEVRAINDASNYTLTIGKPSITATILDQRLQEEFVPGDVIVAFQKGYHMPSEVNRSLDQNSFHGLRHKAMKHDHLRLYHFDNQNKHLVFDALHIGSSGSNRFLYQTKDAETQHKLDTLRIIQALNNRPDVRYAEPNFIRQAYFTPDDEHYAKQWHFPLINLNLAWDIYIDDGTNDVVVAVLDTGTLGNHPDFQDQLTADGYDFISSVSNSLDGDGMDPDPEDPGDLVNGYSSSFHGTHVSGTIAAVTDNDAGVAGVAFNTKIMSLRVLGLNGRGSDSDIIEAMRYAGGLENDSDMLPDQTADILNMSLGGGPFSQTAQDTVDLLRAEGVIIIAAAGNEKTSLPSYPASYDGVVSVSAVNDAKKLASYSNFGDTVDVAAPGGDSSNGVWSIGGDDSTPNGDITYVCKALAGTSMATPHMAGVVAMMKSVWPDLTPEDLDGLLASGILTEDIGDAGRDDSFGYGLIDAYKAIAAAVSAAGGSIPSAITIKPNSLEFKVSDESSQSNTSIQVEKFGTDPLGVTGFEDNVDWLTATAEDIDADGIGSYAVAVNGNGLEDGPYYASILFESTQNAVNVEVTMYKGLVIVDGNPGLHYVLLVDPSAKPKPKVKFWDIVSASNGQYSYRITNVTAGYYFIMAGTDSDNDLIIGDSGEAVGAFISLDQIVIIGIDRSLSGIDFDTSFNFYLPTATSITGINPLLRNLRIEKD